MSSIAFLFGSLAMHVRLIPLGMIAALCAFGCAQNTAPVPVAPSAGSASMVGPNFGHSLSRPGVDFFNLPKSGGSWPDYIVSGPGRAMWFTEFYGNFIGRITMDGTITTFTVPDGDAEGITIGGDGNIWFTEPGAQTIVRMTPQGKATVFQLPLSQNESPRGITLGPDGNVWFVEFYDSYIGRVTPRGTITRFAIPGAAAGPWDIKAGPNGSLYFSESNTDKIGVFDPSTQQFKPSIAVPTQAATPWGILYAPDKHIWFTERTGNKIAEVLSSGTVREFSIPQTNSYPEALAAAADGKLWFTESNFQSLNDIDSKTGKFGAAIVLPAGSIPNGIATGPNKNLWFAIDAYNQTNQIGELMIP